MTETSVNGLSREEYQKWADEQIKKNPKNPFSKGLKRQLAIANLPNGFIFNPDEVYKEKPFVYGDLDGSAYFGFLLPKWVYEEVEVGKGKNKIIKTIKIQKRVPALITKKGLIDIDDLFFNKYKTIITDIPVKMELSWNLESIRDFLSEIPNEKRGIDIFEDIKRDYQHNLYFRKDEWYDVHTLWDMGTPFLEIWDNYPIMELRGKKRVAKTKVQKNSRKFTFNATKIWINPTESTLFRETNDLRPTKYIDECEKLFLRTPRGVEPDSRVEVINGSYSKGSVVPRQEKRGNKFVTIYYNVFSPTMVASINGLYGATEDRAILHVMTRPPEKDKRGEVEIPENARELPSAQEIRDALYYFALNNFQKIKELYNNFENDTKLKTRDFQIWKPLLVLAKYLDDGLYSRIVKFAEERTQIKDTDSSLIEGSMEYQILNIIEQILTEPNKFCVLIKEIRERYNAEKKPHPKTIARILDGLGFNDFKIHTRDGNGYELTLEQFIELKNIQFPSFDSSYSHTDNNNNNNSERSEGKEEEVKESSERNEQNEAVKQVLPEEKVEDFQND